MLSHLPSRRFRSAPLLGLWVRQLSVAPHPSSFFTSSDIPSVARAQASPAAPRRFLDPPTRPRWIDVAIMAAALRERLRAMMAAAATGSGDERPSGTLTPDEWHVAWTGGAVGDTVGEVKRLLLAAVAASESQVRDGMSLLRRLVRVLSLIDAGTTCCACRDAEVVSGLLEALPTVYSPGMLSGEINLRMLAAGPLAAALQALLVRTGRRFSYRPPRSRVPRQPSEACTRTPVDELHGALANPLLMECMADEWEVGLRRLVSGSEMDGVVPNHELGLQALVVADVRSVLTTRPCLVADIVRWLTTLTTHVDRMTAFPYVSTLLQTLLMLADTAPAQVRSSSSLPAAVAAAYRVFAPESSPTDAFHVGDPDATELALTLYAVMAPTGTRSAAALRGNASAMAMLVAAAGAESGSSTFFTSPTALVAHVALDAVRAPGGRLPPAVTERHVLWATTAVMAGQSPDVCAAARLLDALCRRQTPPATAPWAPAAFPPTALPRGATVGSTRCWACGSAGYARGAQRGTLTRLQRCSSCAVGRVCSSECHVALWRASHKRACRGWRKWAAAAVTGGRGGEQRGHVAMYRPRTVDLGGDWKGWAWPAALAAEVEGVGLRLRDVVVYADPGWGIVSVLPEGDYRWKPNAVPAAFLDTPLGKHGGRVLRVVYRAHPPTVRSFGPRSLRLVEVVDMAD